MGILSDQVQDCNDMKYSEMPQIPANHYDYTFSLLYCKNRLEGQPLKAWANCDMYRLFVIPPPPPPTFIQWPLFRSILHHLWCIHNCVMSSFLCLCVCAIVLITWKSICLRFLSLKWIYLTNTSWQQLIIIFCLFFLACTVNFHLTVWRATHVKKQHEPCQ